MLYALGDPVSFLILVLALVVAVVLAGWTSSLVVSRSRGSALRQEGRLRPDPRRHLDPFGAVGAAVSGIGWARPVELPHGRRGPGAALAVLSGPLVVLALGLGLLAVFGVVQGPLPGGEPLALQQGVGGSDLGARALYLGGLMATYVGALSLVPLPPLPGGVALFALAPQTLGWQKAHHQLVERNIGTAVLLALLLIPLGGPTALLPTVLGSVVSPLVRLVSGGGT